MYTRQKLSFLLTNIHGRKTVRPFFFILFAFLSKDKRRHCQLREKYSAGSLRSQGKYDLITTTSYSEKQQKFFLEKKNFLIKDFFFYSTHTYTYTYRKHAGFLWVYLFGKIEHFLFELMTRHHIDVDIFLHPHRYYLCTTSKYFSVRLNYSTAITPYFNTGRKGRKNSTTFVKIRGVDFNKRTVTTHS